MRPPKVKLSANHLGQPLDGGDHIQWDSEIPGFGLRTRRMKKWGSEALSNAPPRETWIFQYGSRRITISQASALKPQAAREVAAQYYAKWLQGIDPQVEKEQAAAKAEEAAKRAAETFGTLAAKYLEKQKTELRRSSFAAQRRYLEKHCASLHRLAIDDIDRAAVIALLNTVEKQRGPASRNRCRQRFAAYLHRCRTTAARYFSPPKRTALKRDCSMPPSPRRTASRLPHGCIMICGAPL